MKLLILCVCLVQVPAIAEVPVSVEEIAEIVANKMGIKDYPLPVVKDMTQVEFDFSHWKESNHDNTINATWPRFFYKENVINYSFKWPIDRLAHEIVHYFQQLSGIDMDHDDIYYELEEQASEIQLWFREKYVKTRGQKWTIQDYII